MLLLIFSLFLLSQNLISGPATRVASLSYHLSLLFCPLFTQLCPFITFCRSYLLSLSTPVSTFSHYLKASSFYTTPCQFFPPAPFHLSFLFLHNTFLASLSLFLLSFTRFSPLHHHKSSHSFFSSSSLFLFFPQFFSLSIPSSFPGLIFFPPPAIPSCLFLTSLNVALLSSNFPSASYFLLPPSSPRPPSLPHASPFSIFQTHFFPVFPVFILPTSLLI